MRKPKYQTIRDELLRRIKEGIYASGGKLPTEKELAAEFAVNRHTVRQSLELLREAKLIMRSPKVGSLVLFGLERPPPPKTTTLLFRFLVNKGPLSEYCAQRKTVFERVAQGFMERHSWVKVKVEAVPSSSGTLMSHSPELFASDTPTVVNLNYHADDARLGKLLPLDVFPDMADAFASVEGRLLYRTLDAAGERHFHAMPLELAGWMMLADMELLGKLGFSADAIPVTWDGFLKLCAAIRRRRGAAGVYPLEKELLYGRMSMTRFLPYIYMAGDGAPVLDEAGRINISTPACARFLEWLSAVYAHAGSATDLSKGSLVRNGKAAFCLSLSGAPERGGLLPVPLPLPGAKARPRTVLHGGFVAIAAQSVKSDAEKEAAWLFVKHLVSPRGAGDALPGAWDDPGALRHVLRDPGRRAPSGGILQLRVAPRYGRLRRPQERRRPPRHTERLHPCGDGKALRRPGAGRGSSYP